MKTQRISQEQCEKIYAERFKIFETHIDNLKNQLEIMKNDKSASKEHIRMLKDELNQAQKILDGFNEVE